MPGSVLGSRNTRIIKALSLLPIRESRFYTIFSVIKLHNDMNTIHKQTRARRNSVPSVKQKSLMKGIPFCKIITQNV